MDKKLVSLIYFENDNISSVCIATMHERNVSGYIHLLIFFHYNNLIFYSKIAYSGLKIVFKNRNLL